MSRFLKTIRLNVANVANKALQWHDTKFPGYELRKAESTLDRLIKDDSLPVVQCLRLAKLQPKGDDPQHVKNTDTFNSILKIRAYNQWKLREQERFMNDYNKGWITTKTGSIKNIKWTPEARMMGLTANRMSLEKDILNSA
jgi:hypothetical protein